MVMSVSDFDENQRPHSPTIQKSFGKDSNENSLYTLNFENVDLSLPSANIRHARFSESSTVFDTCSSSSSTGSLFASYDQKYQEIEFKPSIEAAVSSDEQIEYDNFTHLPEIDKNMVVNEQNNKSLDIIKNSKYKGAKTKASKGFNNLDEGIDLQPFLNGYYTGIYACLHSHCSAEFDLETEIDIHLKEKHNIDKVNNQVNFDKLKKFFYKCIFDSKKCCRKLETVNKIASHICKIHLNGTTIQTQQPHQQNIEWVKQTYEDIHFNNIFMCSYNECLRAFQCEKSLKIHKLKHKSIDNNDSCIEAEKNHICHKCNSRFARPSHLKSHMKTHIGFKCDYCSETFPKHSNLLSHIFEKHKQTDKIYKCHYEGCTKSYLCKMYLSSHITKSHTKQNNTDQTQHDEANHDKVTKTYKCTHNDCNKEFSTSSKLNRHSLTHVKIKKFSCNFEDCNAEFSRQDHLVNHLKFHDDQKIYECDYPNCFSTFKYQNNLITHKKSHLTRNKRPKQDSDTEHEPTYQSHRVSSKNIYQEFKPIVQDSDDETNKEYIDLIDINSDSQNDLADESILSIPKNEGVNEFKCQYCFYELYNLNDYNDHLKSHFDVNKANEKLNEYLIAEHQKNLNIEDQNLVEHTSPFQHDFMFSRNPTKGCLEFEGFNEIQLPDKNSPKSNHLIFNDVQSMVHLDNIDENVQETKMKYNHVININSDDEDVVCSVVLENISGSARTDYKSNHMYIEKYKSKRKNPEQTQVLHKRTKLSESDEICHKKDHSATVFSSSVSSITNKRKKPNNARRKIQIKKHSNLQKSLSMTFQSDRSSLQESLIPQTSLQC